jgi:hypothetical protein
MLQCKGYFAVLPTLFIYSCSVIAQSKCRGLVLTLFSKLHECRFFLVSFLEISSNQEFRKLGGKIGHLESNLILLLKTFLHFWQNYFFSSWMRKKLVQQQKGAVTLRLLLPHRYWLSSGVGVPCRKCNGNNLGLFIAAKVPHPKLNFPRLFYLKKYPSKFVFTNAITIILRPS